MLTDGSAIRITFNQVRIKMSIASAIRKRRRARTNNPIHGRYLASHFFLPLIPLTINDFDLRTNYPYYPAFDRFIFENLDDYVDYLINFRPAPHFPADPEALLHTSQIVGIKNCHPTDLLHRYRVNLRQENYFTITITQMQEWQTIFFGALYFGFRQNRDCDSQTISRICCELIAANAY